MKKYGMRKYGVILMTFLLLVTTLTACGKDPEKVWEKKEYASFSYLAAESEERLVTGLSSDRMYYVQQGSAGYELYVSDFDTLQKEKIYEETDEEEAPHVVMLAASSDNQTALLKYKGVGAEQTEEQREDRKYYVTMLNPEGSVWAEYDVTEYLEEGNPPRAMLLDSLGTVYFMLDGENIRVLAIDSEGKLQCTFTPEEEESVYRNCSLFTDGDGHVYYACASMDAEGSGVSLMELSLSEKGVKEVCHLTVQRASEVYFAGNQGDILFSQGEVLYWLDPESGEKQEILQWMDVDINYGDIRELFLRDNGDIGIYRSYADAGKWCYEVTLLIDREKEGFPGAGGGSLDAEDSEIGDSEPAKEQVILTYATMQLDDQMRSLIVEYNKEHTDCRIEVKEYGEEGTEAGLLRLNADIVAGNGPDIIDLEQIDVGPYIAKGILADLYPLLDADEEMDREDFVPGILRQYEENGKLYGIMAGYQLETLMGKESIVGIPSEWTVERMQEAVVQAPDDGCFIDNLAPLGLLRMLLHMGMGEYLDWENGTCSFDSEEFIRVLELANSMDAKWVDGDMEEYLASGKLIVNRIYVGDISDYLSSMRMFGGEKVSCVGFPSAQGGAALVTPFRPLGISGLNGNQDMAWNFVRSLLGEEFQTREVRFNLPIRLSVLQQKLDREAELAAESGQPLTQDELDAIYQTINVPYGRITFDKNVWDIISEEAESYFNGQKSAEDVVEIIQSRVEIYISENY